MYDIHRMFHRLPCQIATTLTSEKQTQHGVPHAVAAFRHATASIIQTSTRRVDLVERLLASQIHFLHAAHPVDDQQMHKTRPTLLLKQHVMPLTLYDSTYSEKLKCKDGFLVV